MSTTGDEVYDGLRCAVCEERFQPGEDQVDAGLMGERAHAACWDLLEIAKGER